MDPINYLHGLQQVVDHNKKAVQQIKGQSKNQQLKITKVGSSNFELNMEVIRLNKIMQVEWKQKCQLDNKVL